ncbi:MAG: hypothetical protein ACI3W5_16695 [Faecousia sp.]
MENQNQTNNRPYLIIIAILVFLLIVAGIWIAALLGTGGTPSGSGSGDSQTTEESEEVEKLKDSIAIPGFAQLNLKAGTCEQNVALSNPAQNFCYFQISLLLEDGTVIWVSQLIEPGKQSEAITLLQPLDAGTYENVTVHYDCYTMDGSLTQLNSGEITIKLVVQ